MRTWESGRTVDTPPTPGRHARRDERPERDRARLAPRPVAAELEAVLSMLPNVTAIMTAAFESRRAGLVVSRVMRCGGSLPLIAVAVPSGQRLAMLIRDSRCFGLCLVDRSSRLLLKKFGHDTAITPGDPFDTFATRTLHTGAPLLSAAAAAFDCEVVRHLDLEADHEIYVGQIVGVFAGSPATAPLAPANADTGVAHAGAGI